MSSILRLNRKALPINKPLVKPTNGSTLRHIFATNSLLSQSYYQILGVGPKSDKKTIRLAYLKLCKQFHPDLNQALNDPKLQELNKNKLQDINKAYNCLIKDEQRVIYDDYLRDQTSTYDRYSTQMTSSWQPKTSTEQRTYDPSDNFESYYEQIRKQQWDDIFVHRNKGHKPYNSGNSEDNYYGFKTKRRLTNGQIVLFCVAILCFGSALHSLQYLFTKTVLLKRKDTNWSANHDMYAKIVAQAKSKSPEERRKLLEEALKK